MMKGILNKAIGVIAAATLGALAYGAPAFSWAKTYAGTTPDGFDVFNAVGSDAAGNVYGIGTVFNGTFPNDYYDIIVVKYNSAGVQQWATTYDRNGFDDVAFDGKVDAAGNVYVTGYASLDATATDTDVLALKLNTAGGIVYANTYVPALNNKDEYAYAIAVDATGNAYIAGEAGGAGTGVAGLDAGLYRVNSAGSFVWQRIFVGTQNDYDVLDQLEIATNGDAIASGFLTNSSPTFEDAVVVRVTAANALSWTSTYTKPSTLSSDQALGLAVDSSNNVYVTGFSYTTATPSDRQESFVRKLSSAGGVLWTSIYDGNATGITVGWDVAIDPFGNVYNVGETTVGGITADKFDQFIRRISSAGAQTHLTLRATAFGDFYRKVGFDAAGSVIAAGWSALDAASVPANIDGVVSGYNPANLVSEYNLLYNGAGNDWDQWFNMSISGNNIYVCGGTYATFTDANALIAKYAGPTIVPPSSFAVVVGLYLSGNNASLVNSDNDWVRTLQDDINPDTEVVFNATSPVAVPTSMRLFIETSTTRTNVLAFHEAFRYSTNSWVQFDLRTMNMVDTPLTFNLPTPYANYVGPSQAIRTRFRALPTAELSDVDGWSINIDRWVWEIQ